MGILMPMSESAEKFEFGGTATAPTESRVEEEKPAKATLLDQLRNVIEQEVRRPDIEIPIPDRPGVSVVFSPNVSEPDLKLWRKQAGDGKKDGMDFLKFSTVIIGQTCEAILFGGEEVTDSEGNSLNFASREILDMVDEEAPIPNGIRRFWGSDPHLQASALKILDEAGWGEEAEAVERENPTKG